MQNVGLESMAFVFFNHFLDLSEVGLKNKYISTNILIHLYTYTCILYERPCHLNTMFSLQAIEDGSLDTLDNSDLLNTDIPLEIPLPEKPYMNVRELQ